MDSKESFSAEEVNMFGLDLINVPEDVGWSAEQQFSADYMQVLFINSHLLATYCNCTMENCAHKFHTRLNNHAARPRILRVIYPSSHCRDYVLAAGPVAVRAAARTAVIMAAVHSMFNKQFSVILSMLAIASIEGNFEISSELTKEEHPHILFIASQCGYVNKFMSMDGDWKDDLNGVSSCSDEKSELLQYFERVSN
ncbi:hypothetical protein DdX_12238 [Ditylenchus destructor]|uniref:Amyloidogenic glycoprotein heparin-binding domain-containing protein n=1 Tax=Ditylenchus destructor TaxID=166010 RepID=A0AAD4MZ31_9BILA|nr:hypothetical protein DdX_12238 [Ditylenchus destructor]